MRPTTLGSVAIITSALILAGCSGGDSSKDKKAPAPLNPHNKADCPTGIEGLHMGFNENGQPNGRSLEFKVLPNGNLALKTNDSTDFLEVDGTTKQKDGNTAIASCSAKTIQFSTGGRTVEKGVISFNEDGKTIIRLEGGKEKGGSTFVYLPPAKTPPVPPVDGGDKPTPPAPQIACGPMLGEYELKAGQSFELSGLKLEAAGQLIKITMIKPDGSISNVTTVGEALSDQVLEKLPVQAQTYAFCKQTRKGDALVEQILVTTLVVETDVLVADSIHSIFIDSLANNGDLKYQVATGEGEASQTVTFAKKK